VRGVTATGTMPTQQERRGDFSQTRNAAGQLITIYDPLTSRPDPERPGSLVRTAFPGNVIPANRIDPVAANLLRFIPLPNLPGNPFTNANNFVSNISALVEKNDFSFRVDHSIKNNQRLYGRVSVANILNQRSPIYGPELAPASPELGNNEYRQRSVVVNYSNALQHDLVLEVSSSFIRDGVPWRAPSVGFDPAQLSFPNYFRNLQPALAPCFPTIQVAGLGVNVSVPQITLPGTRFLNSTCRLFRDAWETFHQYANLTKVRGAHTLKLGGNFGTSRFSTERLSTAEATYSFSANFTQGPDPLVATTRGGVPFASFLLGAGSGATDGIRSDGAAQNLLFRYYGIYFQDDWKISPKLTFNLGLRYDYTAPWTERLNRITNWDGDSPSPLQASGLSLRGGLAFPGVGGLPRTHFNPDRNNVAPRFGFAYAAHQSTVIRGGFGVFFAPLTGSASVVPATGFETSTRWFSSSDGINLVNPLSNPFPDGFQRASGSSPGLATLVYRCSKVLTHEILRNRTSSSDE
jgi:outer membrane receptor protein involved in Fe transport